MTSPYSAKGHQEKRRINASYYVYWALGSFTLIFVLFLLLFNAANHQNRENVLLAIKNTMIISTPNPVLNLPVSSLTPPALPQIATDDRHYTPTPQTITSSPIISEPLETQTYTFEPSATATFSPFYIVNSEDRVNTIASALQLSPESIRRANIMFGDAIIPGQTLIIPTSEPVPDPQWYFASLDKDQANIFYPNLFDSSSFQMHYMPGTYPSIDPDTVANILEKGLTFIETTYGQPLDFPFDVYVAGTFYELPNVYLRGRSFSIERKVFFLHNGSGDAITQQYFATHELTHLYAWNTFGAPASFLVSEGAAVYTGMKMIENSPYMPLKTFCAAYHKEGALPVLVEKIELNDFRGHNNNLVNYYSSGCFIGYLIETYGVDPFSQLYATNDYEGIYGLPLEQLEQQWKSAIIIDTLDPQLNTSRLVNSVASFMAVNESFYYSFYRSAQAVQAYMELDKARLALISGRFDDFDHFMSTFETLNQGP